MNFLLKSTWEQEDYFRNLYLEAKAVDFWTNEGLAMQCTMPELYSFMLPQRRLFFRWESTFPVLGINEVQGFRQTGEICKIMWLAARNRWKRVLNNLHIYCVNGYRNQCRP